MPLTIDRQEVTEGIRLVVRGEVDITSGDRLEQAVSHAERDRPAVLTLDLTDVDFFDSTGLQIVLDADIRAAEQGRKLVVAVGTGEAGRVMELAQVIDRLTVAVIE